MMKKFFVFVMFVSLFVIMWQVADLVSLNSAGAETVPQMRLRLFAEAQQRHPDVWNNCDAKCVADRIATAPMIFYGSAKQANVSVDDFAKYTVVRDFEWGLEFESTKVANTDCRAKSTKDENKCAPTWYDWGVSYVSRTARYPQELAYAPQIFVWVSPNADQWRVKYPEYRME